MLNILVCIKQVPDTTNIKIDPVTNTWIVNLCIFKRADTLFSVRIQKICPPL